MIRKYLLLLLLIVFPVHSYYIETHKLTETEFETLNNKAVELGIDENYELIRIVSWRHGKLLDDDYNKFLQMMYAVHKQERDYDIQYILSCSGMKKSGWTCTKHEVINIRLSSTDKKDIRISIAKGQIIENIVSLAQYANKQKPLAWDAKMVSVDTIKDSNYKVSYKTIDDCYYTQRIKLISEMGITSYQIDNSEITSFLACKEDEYAGFQKVLMNYVIYEKYPN